jgi:purine-cytosine permease-like protein
MTQYSGSLALQTIGVRVRRPVSAVIVTVLAFALILWLDAAHTTTRFQGAVLLVSYWIPAFVAVIVIAPSRPPPITDCTPTAVCSATTFPAAIPMP